MDTEIREWINEIWAYCEEHWAAVLAGAAVLLVVLLSVVLVGTAKREDRRLSLTQEPAADAADTADSDDGELPADAAAEPDEEVIQETARGMVESLVKSMESAAGASGQKVESIELKIEKAQLTIRYAGEGGEAVKTASEELPVSGDAGGTLAAEDAAAEPADESGKRDFAESAGRPKRFGLDNMNTARSGRVYTEEELLNQIRD